MSSGVFFDYFTDDRPPRNLIREWYMVQDERVCAAVDGTLELLEALPEWSKTDVVKEFTGGHAGLSEIKIDMKDKKPFRHIRLLGKWHRPERIFILLGGLEKKGHIYIPLNAFNNAMKYKHHLESGRGAIDGHI